MTKSVTCPEELGGLASQVTVDYGQLAHQGRLAAATAEPEEVSSHTLCHVSYMWTVANDESFTGCIYLFPIAHPPLNVRLKYLLWFAFYARNVDGINLFTNRSLQHFDMILHLAATDMAASNGNKPLQQPSVSRTTCFFSTHFFVIQ